MEPTQVARICDTEPLQTCLSRGLADVSPGRAPRTRAADGPAGQIYARQQRGATELPRFRQAVNQRERGLCRNEPAPPRPEERLCDLVSLANVCAAPAPSRTPGEVLLGCGTSATSHKFVPASRPRHARFSVLRRQLCERFQAVSGIACRGRGGGNQFSPFSPTMLVAPAGAGSMPEATSPLADPW